MIPFVDRIIVLNVPMLLSLIAVVDTEHHLKEVNDLDQSRISSVPCCLSRASASIFSDCSGGARVFAIRGKRLCCRPRQSDQFCNQGSFQDFGHLGVNQLLKLKLVHLALKSDIQLQQI